MNKKIILATVATIAAVATAQGVKADEVQGTTTAGNEASGVTAPAVETTGAEKNETTETAKQPTAENPNAETGSTSNDNNQSGNATEFSKHDNIIQVTNPEVVIDQSKGTGRYQSFTVEYKNVHFPDDMTINEGDKVTFDLPQEVKFETSYEFDVHNPENAVVGKATADAIANKVTTVFNDYFANHPLNKQMSLKLDASWTDKVVAGKPVTANFNGTVVTANIGKEQEIGKDELIAKWGSQEKEDPTVINWTARINYAKKVLNYVKIIDEMSENQKLVDNYFEIKNIESLDPWVDKGSAMDLVKSISKSDHGFTIKMDRLDHMIYINYKTKLTNAVKDSVNPTNKIELKAENDGSTSYSYVQLVGGKGDASGENKPEPTFEIPNEAPKYEKPEWHGGIPGIPEVRVKPEYTEPIGTVPNDTPVLDKPEYPIPAEPEKPNTPPSVPEIPVTPKEEPKVPSESPKVEPKKEEVKVENKGEVSHKTPVETYKAPMLPQTGSEAGVALSVLGLTVLSLTVVFKKKEN